MKAEETRLLGLLQGRRQYSVPYFQRSYSWGREQWRTLWDDILELYESQPAHQHFLGSIVLLNDRSDASAMPSYLLIDGQQRTVTLCLVLAALRDAAREAGSPLADEIDGKYLLNSGTGEERYKVLCTYQDRAPFAAVMEGAKESPVAPIVEAYRFFRALVKSAEPPLDLERLARVVLAQLSFVTITLGAEDNPYRIFESLNAKGMPLTQGDLLRNYFFMRLPREEHDSWYRSVWLPMQSLLRERFDGYMRDALAKEGEPVRADELYQAWRRRLAPLSTDEIRQVLRELGESAAAYDRMLHPQREQNELVRKRLARLTLWSTTVVHSFHPFLLRLSSDNSRGMLSDEDFAGILFAMECYLVRRLFCEAPVSDDNQLFLQIYEEPPRSLREPLGTPPTPARGTSLTQPRGMPSARTNFREALAHPQYGWPGDEEFREAVVRYPLYFKSHPDQRKLIMEALEESYPHRREIDYARLTIEFIAPLLPRPDWLRETGTDDAGYWRLVGTLGNLTWGIPGRSPSLNVAERKQQILAAGRYGLELVRDIAEVDRWSAEAIEARSRRLGDRAVQVWPGPRHQA